jgi:hypothetical protein
VSTTNVTWTSEASNPILGSKNQATEGVEPWHGLASTMVLYSCNQMSHSAASRSHGKLPHVYMPCIRTDFITTNLHIVYVITRNPDERKTRERRSTQVRSARSTQVRSPRSTQVRSPKHKIIFASFHSDVPDHSVLRGCDAAKVVTASRRFEGS